MSLEKVDIQEVFHKVAEGNLVHVPYKASPLEQQVNWLETKNGDISVFDRNALFSIERALALPEHKELKKRWDEAIAIHTKIRMRFLRLKALSMLENYENKSSTSSAPDISYCRTILADVLVEGTERAKARYGYRANMNQGPSEEDQEADEITDQLEMRND